MNWQIYQFFLHPTAWPTHVTKNAFLLTTRKQNFQRERLCVWTAASPNTWTCMRDLAGSLPSSLCRMRRRWERLPPAPVRPGMDSISESWKLWMVWGLWGKNHNISKNNILTVASPNVTGERFRLLKSVCSGISSVGINIIDITGTKLYLCGEDSWSFVQLCVPVIIVIVVVFLCWHCISDILNHLAKTYPECSTILKHLLCSLITDFYLFNVLSQTCRGAFLHRDEFKTGLGFS